MGAEHVLSSGGEKETRHAFGLREGRAVWSHRLFHTLRLVSF